MTSLLHCFNITANTTVCLAAASIQREDLLMNYEHSLQLTDEFDFNCIVLFRLYSFVFLTF